METRGPDGQRALLTGLQEFREHLGGRLTITLLEGIGSGFEVHDVDEAVLVEASALLQRRTMVNREPPRWQPVRAVAR
jgi:3-dehydroquinate synthase